MIVIYIVCMYFSEELENDAWDTGMDAEMQAGFLEFLKMSNQIKR